MTTASVFLRDALKAASVIGVGEAGGYADEMEVAQRILNQIIGTWRSNNVPVNAVSDLAEELDYADGYEAALFDTLTERLCSHFRTTMPDGLALRAAVERRKVFKDCQSLGRLKLPCALLSNPVRIDWGTE